MSLSHPLIRDLQSYAEKDTRTVVALHSGTSTDGVTCALAKISGSGIDTQWELKHLQTFEFSDVVHARLFDLYDFATARIDRVCQANVLLGQLFADAVLQTVKAAGLNLSDLDGIGSSGQIVYHVREGQLNEEVWIGDTIIPSALDLGEGAVIAERTGVMCVTNLRIRDMIVGGVGNPLVSYGDWVMFQHPDKARAIQNIGGIANPTIIPAGGSIDDVFAFDTGPGNMIIDGLVSILTEGRQNYDHNGQWAGRGRPHDTLVEEFLRHPFINRKPPKAAGRELFGKATIQYFYERATVLGLPPEDMLASATALTARSIQHNYREFVYPRTQVDEVLLCGGGANNLTLKAMLDQVLYPAHVTTVADAGVPVDGREVLAVAMITNESLLGNPANVPSSTGAQRKVILGQFYPAQHSPTLEGVM